MSAAGLIAFLRRRCPPSTSDEELIRAYADRHDAEELDRPIGRVKNGETLAAVRRYWEALW
jgi:hypothetical protein